MELFTHTVACHTNKASAMTEVHLMSPVMKREFVTTSEWERPGEQAKERPGLAVFFQPSTSVRRHFILSIRSPHSTPHHPISVSSQRQPLSRWWSPTDLLYLHCTAGHLWGTRKQHSEKKCRGVRGMVGERQNGEPRAIKGMNSRWALRGITAFLRLALTKGWRIKPFLSILFIQQLTSGYFI